LWWMRRTKSGGAQCVLGVLDGAEFATCEIHKSERGAWLEAVIILLHHTFIEVHPYRVGGHGEACLGVRPFPVGLWVASCLGGIHPCRGAFREGASCREACPFLGEAFLEEAFLGEACPSFLEEVVRTFDPVKKQQLALQVAS